MPSVPKDFLTKTFSKTVHFHDKQTESKDADALLAGEKTKHIITGLQKFPDHVSWFVLVSTTKECPHWAAHSKQKMEK